MNVLDERRRGREREREREREEERERGERADERTASGGDHTRRAEWEREDTGKNMKHKNDKHDDDDDDDDDDLRHHEELEEEMW